MTPENLIGQQIRATHPYAFRYGEWATITNVFLDTPEGKPSRLVYEMKWPDGVRDSSPVYDYSYGYEFRILWESTGYPLTKNA